MLAVGLGAGVEKGEEMRVAVERFAGLVATLGEFEGGGGDWSEVAICLCETGWVKEAVTVGAEIRCRGDKRTSLWDRVVEVEGGEEALRVWLGEGVDEEEETKPFGLCDEVEEEEEVRREIRNLLS